LSIEFAEGEALGLMLDVKGIAVATGSACVAKSQRVPPVLAAIGLPEALARGNVILSFGKDNTEAELDNFVETFAKAVSAVREMSSEWEDFQKGLIGSALSEARSAF
jgi:cysteine desulfurase